MWEKTNSNLSILIGNTHNSNNRYRLCFIVLSIFLINQIAFGQIYRDIDANGGAYFSDKKTTASQSVLINDVNTVRQIDIIQKPTASNLNDLDKIDYKLKIITPKQGSTYRNENKILVDVRVEPAIEAASKNRLALLLNSGLVFERNNNGMFELVNLDRGEHVLQAKLLDLQDNVVTKSDEVRFFFHKTSILLKKN